MSVFENWYLLHVSDLECLSSLKDKSELDCFLPFQSRSHFYKVLLKDFDTLLLKVY